MAVCEQVAREGGRGLLTPLDSIMCERIYLVHDNGVCIMVLGHALPIRDCVAVLARMPCGPCKAHNLEAKAYCEHVGETVGDLFDVPISNRGLDVPESSGRDESDDEYTVKGVFPLPWGRCGGDLPYVALFWRCKTLSYIRDMIHVRDNTKGG